MNSEKLSATKNMSALEELTTLPLLMLKDNPYILDWKAQGHKVFGYTCSYVPEEVVAALEGPAKILMVRLGGRGAETTEDADIHMHKFQCSFSRSIMQLGIQGDYDFLDGVIVTSGCETMRRTFAVWEDIVKMPVFMISVPHSTQGDNRVKWYRDEIANLESDLCEKYALGFSKESLRKTVKTYNEYRTLMGELYELRKLDQPKVTGAEALRIMQAGFSMPKDIFNEKLKEAIVELKARPGISNNGARIMIGGSYTDDPFLVDIIENLGATVVTDSLCSGRRYIDTLVDESGELMPAITDRYFNHTPCPRMIEEAPQRIAFVKQMVSEFRVDGVVFEKIAFCDNFAGENLLHRKELEADGVAVTEMETEYLATDKGRYRTRIQAFLEKIGK